MRKFASIITAAAGALVMAAATIPAPADAGSGVSGLSPGWNPVIATQCIQVLHEGVTYLYVYPLQGTLLWTNEKAVIIPMEDLCTSHAPFLAYSPDGVAWTANYYDADLNPD